MTVADWLSAAQTRLTGVGVSSGRLDGLILLEQVTDQSREQLSAHPEQKLTAKTVTTLDELLTKRLNRTPLVHLTGRRQFYNLELEITPNVLTPRVETERLVELAIEHAPENGRLLDLGTGSGAIALAVAAARPDLDITATDISDEALAVARRNAKRHDLSIKFVQSDLLKSVFGRFDVVAANLPYLPSDAELMPEVTREPDVALFGGSDGLDLYRRFFTEVTDHLKPGGSVIIEADPWQHLVIAKMAEAVGLQPLNQDYFILAFKLSPQNRPLQHG